MLEVRCAYPFADSMEGGKKGGRKKKGGKRCLDIFSTNQVRFDANQSFRVLSVGHGLTHDVVFRGQGIWYEM